MFLTGLLGFPGGLGATSVGWGYSIAWWSRLISNRPRVAKLTNCVCSSSVPGWHTTIFPPYFVAGAIYSGFAMVLMLAIPIRKIYGLEDFITERHLQNSAKVMLATGLIVAYGYGIEAFMGWYSGDRYGAFHPRKPPARAGAAPTGRCSPATSSSRKCCGFANCAPVQLRCS